MNWFWAGFWPNVAATFLGVIAGVPVALWLNRLSIRQANARLRAGELEHLRVGLEAVLTAFNHNRPRIRALLEMPTDQFPLDLELDTSAWEVSRDQIVPVLREADLQRRIAYHFDRLQSLARLSALYLETVTGVTSALSGIEQKRAFLRQYIVSMSRDLLDEADAIRAAVKAKMPEAQAASHQ
ncbi:hypothetical protein [Cupriavidus sp. IK-TO18]|jgi:hypothetical protein|uniref:hypothetical protein n=1 Tax=Cupriavidus sp. IK-TO18 TaxID=2782182 RepID=UPI00189C2095|nr:hypothetical protein [Cupriavidus sp. IK-TO18]MBF6989294.1 hypothetical protein [Cupriavidus sp. IK-TO18]